MAHMIDLFGSAKQKRDELIARIVDGAGTSLDDLSLLALELKEWLGSTSYAEMVTGENYYEGRHDILNKKREMTAGEVKTELKSLPNNRTIDNQYARAVDMKVNYLRLKSVSSDNEAYSKLLDDFFGAASFLRTFRILREDSHNGGVGYLYPYIDESGKFRVTRFESAEFLPFYSDYDRTQMEFGIRFFSVERYAGPAKETVELADLYTAEGVYHYVFEGRQALRPDYERGQDNSAFSPYVTTGKANYTWGKCPVVPFKLNPKEIPLIRRVKSLQDGINQIISVFGDAMEDTPLSTILVIRNYDGTDLGEFRANLATYGAVKVRDEGGIDTLNVEVNAGNYESILKLLKKALIENARSYDAKDERLLGGSPNQMNIQSMYSDIDLDASAMEIEYKAALDELIHFYCKYLEATGKGSFYEEDTLITFERDMPVSTSELIANISASVGLVSTETLLRHHPLVENVAEELARLKAEREEVFDYPSDFGHGLGDEDDAEEGE